MSDCEAAGIGAAAPEAELRLEKLARELALEAVDLPADGGLPSHNTTVSADPQ